MVQKGCLADFDGSDRAAMECYLFSVFHWQGDGQADFQDRFRLLIPPGFRPHDQKTENVLIFLLLLHTQVLQYQLLLGLKCFFLPPGENHKMQIEKPCKCCTLSTWPVIVKGRTV